MLSTGRVVTYVELALFLFGGIVPVGLIDLPNFTATVFVAKAFIIDNKVIVATIQLSLVILVLAQLLKHSFSLSNLAKPRKRHVNT